MTLRSLLSAIVVTATNITLSSAAEAQVTYTYTGLDFEAGTSFTYVSPSVITTQTYINTPCKFQYISYNNCSVLFDPAGSPDFTFPHPSDQGTTVITGSATYDGIAINHYSPYFGTGGEFAIGALGSNGSYSYIEATLTVSGVPAASAAPEPGTWAMMILGLGVVGFAMRRQEKFSTRVSYAG